MTPPVARATNVATSARRAALALGVSACVVGCSAVGWLGGTLGGLVGATSDDHCDRRYVDDGGSNGPFCQEITDTVAGGQFQDDCRNKFKASAGDGKCPRDGIIAGCKNLQSNQDNSEVWDWFYDVSGLERDAGFEAGTLFPNAPKTVDDVKKLCADPSRYSDGAELATP